jgi:hypothetical protein
MWGRGGSAPWERGEDISCPQIGDAARRQDGGGCQSVVGGGCCSLFWCLQFRISA